MESSLPKGWIKASLFDVLSNKKYSLVDGPFGSHLKRSDYVNEGIPLIRILNIGEDYRFNSNDLINITEEKFLEIKRSEINPGDILFSKAGTIGRVCFVPDFIQTGSITSSCAKIKIHESLNSKYFLYFLSSSDTQNYLLSIATGSTRLNLNLQSIKTIPVLLPPLAEQHRIVVKLDALMQKVEATKRRLDKIPQLLKRFRQSVLAAAVSGKLTEEWREKIGIPGKWEKTPLGNTLLSLDQGWSPKCENYPSLDDSTWGVIKTTAVQHMNFQEHENKQLPKNLKPEPQFELKADDVLITRAGPRVRVGVCCHVKSPRKRLMICDKVYRLRANKELIAPGFIEILLNTWERLEELEGMKTGISDSGVNLTQSKIKAMQIERPSIREQAEIITKVEQLLTLAHKIERRLNYATTLLQRLPQTILAKAFRGELVEQDPDDEPAGVLLERIRNERENGTRSKVSRSKTQKKTTIDS